MPRRFSSPSILSPISLAIIGLLTSPVFAESAVPVYEGDINWTGATSLSADSVYKGTNFSAISTSDRPITVDSGKTVTFDFQSIYGEGNYYSRNANLGGVFCAVDQSTLTVGRSSTEGRVEIVNRGYGGITNRSANIFINADVVSVDALSSESHWKTAAVASWSTSASSLTEINAGDIDVFSKGKCIFAIWESPNATDTADIVLNASRSINITSESTNPNSFLLQAEKNCSISLNAPIIKLTSVNGSQPIFATHGQISLTGDDISILAAEADNSSISMRDSSGGLVEVTANRSIQVRGSLGDRFMSGETGNSKYHLTAIQPGSTISIDGTIFNHSPTNEVVITLPANSTLNTSEINVAGNTPEEIADNSQTQISLGTGAVWNATDNSIVKTVQSDNGIINIQATNPEQTVEIGAISGKTVLPVDTVDVAEFIVGSISGSLTVVGDSAMNDRSGNPQQLAQELADLVTTQDKTHVSVAAEEGLISDAFTASLNSEGEVTSVRGSLNSFISSVDQLMRGHYLLLRSHLNDVSERMGELRTDEGNVGSWIRVYGGKNKFIDDDVSNRYRTIQLGADASVRHHAGRYYFGLTAFHNDGQTDLPDGTGDDTTYGGGIYAGYFADSGWYIDAVAKFMRFRNDLEFQYLSGQAGGAYYKTWGKTFSVETGYRVTGDFGIYAEPQFELSVGRINATTFRNEAGVTIEQNALKSVIARTGVAFGKIFEENRGNLYFKVSVLNDFNGRHGAKYSIDGLSRGHGIDMGGAWAESTVGGTIRIGRNGYLYGDITAGTGSTVSNPFRWSVGGRVFF